MDKIRLVDEAQLRKDIIQFKAGDQIKVFVKIPEADKVRIHHFEGIVIRRRGQGMGSTFTVRKVSFGEGIERTFHINSPSIEKIQLIKTGKANRAKLYYLRGKTGKSAKIKEESISIVPNSSTFSSIKDTK